MRVFGATLGILSLSLACSSGGGGPAGPIENPPITAPGNYELLVASSGGVRRAGTCAR